jgi:hypothetical protein
MAKGKIKHSKRRTLNYGFIYPVINKILGWLKYINLVESFKYIVLKFSRGNKSDKLELSRFATDIFIVFKWVFVATLWILKVNSSWLVYFIWYLLAANLFTYFYYHTWSSEILNTPFFEVDRIKRRFINLILAFSYSIFGFAYLYSTPYSSQFSWGKGEATFLQSIWFSVSNSLTANYDQVRPITDFGYSLSLIQLIMMFVFITIIIGGSIPQSNQIKKEGQNGIQK